jgi:hypothetical protein
MKSFLSIEQKKQFPILEGKFYTIQEKAIQFEYVTITALPNSTV